MRSMPTLVSVNLDILEPTVKLTLMSAHQGRARTVDVALMESTSMSVVAKLDGPESTVIKILMSACLVLARMEGSVWTASTDTPAYAPLVLLASTVNSISTSVLPAPV